MNPVETSWSNSAPSLETPFATTLETSGYEYLVDADVDVEYEDLELERREEEGEHWMDSDEPEAVDFVHTQGLSVGTDLGEETETLLAGVRDAALGLWERTLVAAAIAKGTRDLSQLTNLVFFRRHPDRNNRPLRRDEPRFAEMAEEWNRIRQNIVLPALAASPTGSSRPPLPGSTVSPSGRGSGKSSVAAAAPRQWSGRRRNPPWTNTVFGLVVHQTGGKLPCDALRRGENPVARAVETYARNTGTHYVCGWGGRAAGELLQVADDFEKAHGVGMGKQRRSVEGGSWVSDVSPPVVEHWRRRWPGRANPLDLLPAGRVDANDPFVHVEMIPVVVPWCNNGAGLPGPLPPPMQPGLRFTRDQHDAIADLAVDLAQRHGWPPGWYNTERLLGHEDLAPIERHSKSGGWDPGALRSEPYFDWDYVKERIRQGGG